jgi:REP element-mobilizing transposase RayT
MPSRNFHFEQGNYYHLYNRGVGKQEIFFKTEHNTFPIRQIKKHCSEYSVQIPAYCLMPNHYHLLVHQTGTTSISKFMHVLFNSYSQAIDKDTKRTGALFEGRFKHRLITEEDRLAGVFRNIHLNPVRAGLVTPPEAWPFSNYREVVDGSGPVGDFIARCFGDADSNREFVNAGASSERPIDSSAAWGNE